AREDDKIETIKKRFKFFLESSPPVISYYGEKGKVRKDMASRVIAEGLLPEQTPVSKVMTRTPIFVTSDTLAIKDLQKMVQVLPAPRKLYRGS
ncbi:hypothetical protein S245_062862, partial [Arachis hypogaea]